MSFLAIFVTAVLFWGQGSAAPCGHPKIAVGDIGPALAGQAHMDGCLAVIDWRVADLYYDPSPPYRCAVIFHEVGHLYGRKHSKRGVMQATWHDDAIPPICWRIAPMSRFNAEKVIAFTAQRREK